MSDGDFDYLRSMLGSASKISSQTGTSIKNANDFFSKAGSSSKMYGDDESLKAAIMRAMTAEMQNQ